MCRSVLQLRLFIIEISVSRCGGVIHQHLINVTQLMGVEWLRGSHATTLGTLGEIQVRCRGISLEAS